MNQWLVRTAQNILAGPYSKDQLCQLIKDGHLGLQDEVCQANQYWFFLHEREEVTRQLAIEMPRAESSDEEETQTETQTLPTTPTQAPVQNHVPVPAPAHPAHSQIHAQAQAHAQAHAEVAQHNQDNDIPEMPGDPNSQTEHTAMVSSDAFRKLKAPSPLKKAPPPAASSPAPANGAPNGVAPPSGDEMVLIPTGGQAAKGPSPFPPATPPEAPALLGRMERTRFWHGLTWVLVVGVGLVIYAVVHLMKTR